MKLFMYIKSFFTLSIVFNSGKKIIKHGKEIEVKEKISEGTGMVYIENLKMMLENESAYKKAEILLKRFTLPPQGMAEAGLEIENLKNDIEEETRKGRIYFIIYFVDDSTLFIPEKHPNDGTKLYISTDKELASKLKTPYPGVYGFNPRDRVSYQLPLNEDTPNVISSIVRLDLIGLLTYQNMQLYRDTKLHSFYCFVKLNEIDSFTEQFFEKAKKCKDLGKFCLIPFKDDKEQLRTYGLTEEDLPAILFLHEQDKYSLKKCLDNDVRSFINDVIEKKVEPVFISEKEPLNNENLNVKIITRNNLQAFKKNQLKDRLLIFHSPQCGFCVKLKPIIDEIGSIAKSTLSEKLEIGACDVTQNDISDFDVTSVPLIVLIKAKTNEIIKYEDKERTAVALGNFIKNQGSFNIDISPFIKEELFSKKVDKEMNDNDVESDDIDSNLNEDFERDL